MSSEGARGYMDIDTPEAERELLEMSLSTQKQSLEMQLLTVNKHIKTYTKVYGDMSLTALTKKIGGEQIAHFKSEYEKHYALIIEKNSLEHQLTMVVNELVQRTSETFETMFLRQAKNLLPPEKYSQITNYAHSQLKELYEQV